jgi:response regulator RpfG family c-di-GMP phosphodiesterase
VFHRADGLNAAVQLAQARRGTQFDPAVVDAFCGAAGEVLADRDEVSDWGELIEREPGLQRRLVGSELDTALEAIADFTDLRSPTRAGHSRAVASLAAQAAELCGLAETEVTTLLAATRSSVDSVGYRPTETPGEPLQLRAGGD